MIKINKNWIKWIVLLIMGVSLILAKWLISSTDSPQNQHTVLIHDCTIQAGCTLPDGSHIRFHSFQGVSHPFDITVSHTPEQTKHIFISFSMQGMDMGFNRYALQPKQNRWLAQQVRIPFCSQNRHDYLAEVQIQDTTYQIPFNAQIKQTLP